MGLFGKKKAAAALEAGVDAAVINETAADGAGADVSGDAGLSDEIIAVITAAVSAYEAEQYTQTLYVRKLSRAAGMRPVWGTTGTQEAIDVRRI